MKLQGLARKFHLACACQAALPLHNCERLHRYTRLTNKAATRVLRAASLPQTAISTLGCGQPYPEGPREANARNRASRCNAPEQAARRRPRSTTTHHPSIASGEATSPFEQPAKHPPRSARRSLPRHLRNGVEHRDEQVLLRLRTFNLHLSKMGATRQNVDLVSDRCR